MGGGCSQDQSPCSLNEFNTVDTCSRIRYKREANANYQIDPLGPGGIQPIGSLGLEGIEPIGSLGQGELEPISLIDSEGMKSQILPPNDPLGGGEVQPMPISGPVPNGGCGTVCLEFYPLK